MHYIAKLSRKEFLEILIFQYKRNELTSKNLIFQKKDNATNFRKLLLEIPIPHSSTQNKRINFKNLIFQYNTYE